MEIKEKGKYTQLKIVCLLLICSLIITGCAKNRALISPQATESIVTGSSNAATLSAEEDTKDRSAEIIQSIDSIPKEIMDVISLGMYDHVIRLGGEQRDDRFVKTESQIVFPEGKVVSISAGTTSSSSEFVDISADSAKEFIHSIENATFVDDADLGDILGVGARIVLLNTQGEYIYVSLTPFASNKIMIRYFYPASYDGVDDNYKWSDRYWIKSEELVQKIIDISGQKDIDPKTIKPLKNCVMQRIPEEEAEVYGLPSTITTKQVAFNDKDTQEFHDIVVSLRRSMSNYGQRQFEIMGVLTDEDGEDISIKIIAQTIIIIEGNNYDLSEKDWARLQEILLNYNLISDDEAIVSD